MARPDEPRRLITLGWQVADWIETYLVHGPGDVQGRPIQLDDEQLAYVVKCYELDQTGRRKVDEAMFSRPKGRAKTELLAMIGCAEFLGPVRFAGFDAQGEPVGQPVTYPFIRCLSTEEKQAADTSYRNIAYMLSHGGAANEYDVDIGNDWQTSTRIFQAGGGEVRPSTGSNAAKDGGKESHSIAEETHLYTSPELRGMYTTVQQNTMKRKLAEPWMNQATTMYGEGENSIAEITHRAAKIGAARLLVDHREAPGKEIDLTDRAAVLEGLDYVYGSFAPVMDLEKVADYVMDRRRNPRQVIRYFFNRATPPIDAYFDGRSWERSRLPRRVARGERVCLGFDGSDSKDETWIRAFALEDRYLFTPTFPDGQKMRWRHPDTSPAVARQAEQRGSWKVPRGEVHAAFEFLMEFFTVVRAYLDPPYWQTELKEWQNRWGDEVFVGWETWRTRAMGAALERFDTDMRAGEMIHDGDPEVQLQIGWAKGEKRSGTVVIAQPGVDDRKIDAAMSTTLAYECGMDVLASETEEEEQEADFFFE